MGGASFCLYKNCAVHKNCVPLKECCGYATEGGVFMSMATEQRYAEEVPHGAY
jgi:hypothetical protein